MLVCHTTGLEADHQPSGLLRKRLTSLAERHPALLHVWSAGVSLGGVGFTTDGAWVLGYPRDEGSIQAWDAQTGSVAFAPLDSAVVDVAPTAQGPRLLTIDADGAHVWDSRSRQQVASLAHDTPVSWASFVSEGRFVLTLAEDRTARLWDAAAGRAVLALADVEEIFDAAVDGDAVTLLVRNRGGEPAAWNNRTRKRIVFDDHKAQNAELSADRRYVLLFDDDASASVWDPTSGRQLTDLGGWEWVDHARLSPDGQRVAMVSRDGWATVWDIASNREVRTMRHQGAVLDAAFSPDGRWLATASTDQQARVWDIGTGEDVTPPLWHESTVVRVAFSPDGTHLATTTENELVRLWELPAGRGVTLPHSESVRTAAFSPDGRRVLTATNFTAQLWNTAGNDEKPAFVWQPGSHSIRRASPPTAPSC
jgi:WD40 repeat protein